MKCDFMIKSVCAAICLPGLILPALCLELRKSLLKAKYGIDDDEELTRMVFAEAVARKEQQWEPMKRSNKDDAQYC